MDPGFGKYKVTKEQQLKELTSRITPIVNVDIVVSKKGKYLVGRRALGAPDSVIGWLFPGSRMHFDEKPQETALRVLKNELPGVNAKLKKLITVTSSIGTDKRANGITISYLFEYISGTPKPNSQLDMFKWVNLLEFSSLPDRHPVAKSIFPEIDQTVKAMNTTEDEILVETDKNNKDIGSIIKREAHSTNTRYHRAAHIMLFNSRGEVVLQQRSTTKTRAAGFWDMPGGHQTYGNTIYETATQELKEEMGVKTKLTLKRVGLKITDSQAEYYYLYYGKHDGPYNFDKNEVEQIKSFDCQKLLDGKYDKEFQILPHVKEYVEELRDYWESLKNKHS